MSQFALAATVLVVIVSSARGDPNDWVNIEYVQQSGHLGRGSSSTTHDAQNDIVRNADDSFLINTWSITNSQQILPPSNNPHDYMSWAPYHWPNCNWCGDANMNPYHRRMSHLRHKRFDIRGDLDSAFMQKTLGVTGVPPLRNSENTHSQLHGDTVSKPFDQESSSRSTNVSAEPTPVSAQVAAKTHKAPCTPSPTKTMPPSATWTTCPYITRDGKVNPDVRTLNGPSAINGVSQVAIYNALAYAFRGSAVYSQNFVRFIDAFFLNSSTQMNPNMNYGQMVRGPGPKGRLGTFTGVLDLRGLVKVVNAILLMKAVGSPDWTYTRDQLMRDWMSQYSVWLTDSDIGKIAASRPNNHGSFYVSQLAAAKVLAGENASAINILQHYFNNQFLDQIAKSGEQPFEAVRTRPYHYRCFNLEAMITNAKLGDQLGLNLWTVKSKHGATIQTAVDFVMSTNPKNEDIAEILPHIASVAAAYGDPTGKYASFLKNRIASYQTKPFWFYDQTTALPNSPAALGNKRSVLWGREDSQPTTEPTQDDPLVEFECPRIFDYLFQVEIDNGIFVTCEELKPFYEAPFPDVE